MKTIEGGGKTNMTKDIKEQKTIALLSVLGLIAYIGILINHFFA